MSPKMESCLKLFEEWMIDGHRTENEHIVDLIEKAYDLGHEWARPKKKKNDIDVLSNEE